MQRKNLEIEDFEVKTEGDGAEKATYIYGYANTKGKPDAYGDIPHNLDGNPVYDLSSRFKSNPAALVDHTNSVGNIFGVFIVGKNATAEDEKGLRIKLRLMDNPQTDIAKHAVEAYKSGFARAFSIGGQWKFEDPKNKSHLTTAIIHEISGVALGADGSALSTVSKPKSLPEITEAERKRLVLEELIKEYRASLSREILETIQILTGAKKWQ